MAFDSVLAQRVRAIVAIDPVVSERKMFGGLCFMSSGNMCFAVMADSLMVRVGSDGYDDALRQPHARVMDLSGRVMRGFVLVANEGVEDDFALREWLELGLAFARSLPAKRRSAP